MVKALALWSPLRWPHGWRTSPMQDPKVDGTRRHCSHKISREPSRGLRASRQPTQVPSSQSTGSSARCQSATGDGGPTSTPTITCVSSACEAEQGRRNREAVEQGDEADEREAYELRSLSPVLGARSWRACHSIGTLDKSPDVSGRRHANACNVPAASRSDLPSALASSASPFESAQGDLRVTSDHDGSST